MQASEGPKVCVVNGIAVNASNIMLCWRCMNECEGREGLRVSEEQLGGHELRSGGSEIAAVAFAAPAAM